MVKSVSTTAQDKIEEKVNDYTKLTAQPTSQAFGRETTEGQTEPEGLYETRGNILFPNAEEETLKGTKNKT